MTDTTPTPGTRSDAEELMAIGRDREAVAAASTATGPADGAAQLGEIVPMLQALVAGIRLDQLDDPTPCSQFRVNGVLDHMIGGSGMFAPAFRGETAEGADRYGEGTPMERFGAATTDLLDAVRSPGAKQRTIVSPFGEVSGDTFARYVAFDGLVHGWDLATATGQAYEPRAELVAEAEAFARGLLQPEMRDGDTFAAETEPPTGSTPIERLAAFAGRTVPPVL